MKIRWEARVWASDECSKRLAGADCRFESRPLLVWITMTVVPHDKLADPSSPVSREADSPATLVAMLRDRDYPKRPPRNARVLFLCTVFALGFLINSLLGTSVLLLSPAHTAATLPQAQYNGAGGGGGGRADDERRQTESLFLLPQATHPAVNSSNGPKWNYTAASSKSFTDRCFYVEDICRSSHRWFYRPPKSKSTTTTTTTTTTNPNGAATTKRQPDVLLMKEFEAFRVNSAANNPSYRQSYRFERNASVLTPSQWDECVDSPIENHVRAIRRDVAQCPPSHSSLSRSQTPSSSRLVLVAARAVFRVQRDAR
jgi:hypothetical protein